jgi:hypothetical protein
MRPVGALLGIALAVTPLPQSSAPTARAIIRREEGPPVKVITPAIAQSATAAQALLLRLTKGVSLGVRTHR